MKPMKLLLIDDDTFLLDMYAAKFKEAGDEVFAAQNALEALRILDREAGIEVVVLDMVMPGTSGVDLIKKIKEQKQLKKVRCIVLSNQGEQADIKSAIDEGALGYIVKAESIPSEVVSKVHELVTTK